MAGKRFILGFILSLALVVFFSWPVARQAQASCGAVSCFVVIGSQQQVPSEGLLTVNAIYNYTPMRLLDGTNGIIPGLDQGSRQMILDHHQETRTITQNATLDLNYGLTERFGLQLTLPMCGARITIDGLGEDGANGQGEPTNFSADGIGDIRVGLKYNMLPTLRSLVVLGFGVYLPTGNTQRDDNLGNLMESPSQIGRGAVGLNPTSIKPMNWSRISSINLRQPVTGTHSETTMDTSLGMSGISMLGLNLVTVPWLVVSSQFNYRYMVHDNFSSSLYPLRHTCRCTGFPW